MSARRNSSERGPSDGELIAACRTGRREAFGELISRYQDRVYNLAFRLTGNSEDASDAAQEAFLKAYRALDGFRGESGFYTWVFRITVNVVRNQRRFRAVRPQAASLNMSDDPDERGGSLAAGLAARDADPVDEVSRVEQKEIVERALAQMEDEQRMMIVLRDIEGRGYGEIADLLSCPRGTVKSRIHRARMALREILAPVLADAYGAAE